MSSPNNNNNNNNNNGSSSLDVEMRVLKRNGNYEDISFDKILKRVKILGHEANLTLNYTQFVMKVIDQLYDGISTSQIDELAAEQCASLITQNQEYGILASRIVISNCHKNTPSTFYEAMEKLYNFKDVNGNISSLLSEKAWLFIQEHKEFLEYLIDNQRDYLIDYFGFKTLERSYLMKTNKQLVERPQYMWLRVAVGIHGVMPESDIKVTLQRIRETYELMSQKYFIHATPTLYNAATPRPQLSSCYLIAMESDSIDGIFNTLKECAQISKWAGGIGLHIHNVRGYGTHIRGTNGHSNGLVPMLKVFNSTARYVDQCLDPNTIVYTKHGAKQIKNIVVGDKVITDDGCMYKIRKVLDYQYLGDAYSLDVKHSLYPLIATDMHPLWTIKNDKYYQREFKHITNALDRNLLVPEFIEVKNIRKNDFIGFPIPTYIKDIPHYTEDDCRFYGILLGDGCISSKTNAAYVALNTDTKQETISFVEKYLSKLNIKITYSYQNEKYVRLTWTRNNMFKFTHEMLYDSNKEKYVMSSMLHLPENKILSLIKGILETDGKVKDYQIVLEITSQNIVESVRYMLLRLGMLTSGTSRDRRNESHITKHGRLINNTKISYILIIPKTEVICNLFKEKNLQPSKSFTFFKHKDYLFSIVNSNTLIENYDGRVIDIEVDNEEHHNFLTHNGLVKNGGGKRNGSFAIYLEPWHSDIFEFLDMRKNHGDEELRARDLFYALWISDLFMERVNVNADWSLFCPDICPGLSDVYGDKFKQLYLEYEEKGLAKKVVKARDLWFAILDSQMETGTPYLLYKDSANQKSNQKNLGTIKSSNLCSEIVEYSDENETAVCNLASIALNRFVQDKEFDYNLLVEVAKVITRNLNKVIDVNFYPTEKTRRSNMRHRPIGIGVQGLADTFALMDIPFHSEEAREVNKEIFESIYYGALLASNEISKDRLAEIEMGNLTYEYIEGPSEKDIYKNTRLGSYSTFYGSPMSDGLFQFDLWNKSTSNRYDWESLRQDIIKYGLRNSLLVAPMPTASTSQILGNNECFEPFTSNIYSRRTLAGEFIIANKYLMKELQDLGLWNSAIKDNIIANKGSIQQIEGIPQHIKDKYKIVWEIPMRHLIDMAAERGPFICQSQSMNLWVEDPNYKTLTAMHFYSWKAGLKTGIYYLRRKPKHQPQQFTIVPKQNKVEDNDEDEVCEMCSG